VAPQSPGLAGELIRSSDFCGAIYTVSLARRSRLAAAPGFSEVEFRSIKKERCAIFIAQRSWCSLAPERREAAPVRSKKPHREAPAEVVDPETTLASKHLASTQEGGQHEYPAILRANGEASR
jgi:hypothetical protein